MNLKTKRILSIIIAFIALLFSVLFIFKQSILHYIVQSRIERFNHHYHARLSVGNTQLEGLSLIHFQNISLLPDQGNDTLLKIDSVNLKMSLWKLFRLKFAIEKLDAVNTDFHLMRHGEQTNYMFLFGNHKKTEPEDSLIKKNYAQSLQSLINKAFAFIPSSLTLKNFNVHADLNDTKFSFSTDRFLINNKKIQSVIILKKEDKLTHWNVNGQLDAKQTSGFFKLFADNHQRIEIPYIDQKWNARIGFDTIQFSFKAEELDNNMILSGAIQLNNLLINQPRIGQEDVLFSHGNINYQIRVGENFIELDSASRFVFNKISFNPYFKITKNNKWEITLMLNKSRFQAQDLFESLPIGLFKNLEGIKTQGDLSYHFAFHVDLKNPDSLIFESDLKSYHFHILKFGLTDFTYINSPFIYTAYEKGAPVRNFEVGAANPDFRPIERIPDMLKKAIMTSEDGGFYQHRGFLPEAFRESIITNIKEKRFARGGSTISMQLVKNLFLSRNKTITRKIEEAMIVWMIENCGLSSKDRMYEIYLNILEMGPKIYGVNEGARFYFNKDVSKLTLAECLYLASIIPHPKFFKYSFDTNGNIRNFLFPYFKFVSEKMLRKEYISQEDIDRLEPKIELKGPAKKFILPNDSLPADSLQIDNF